MGLPKQGFFSVHTPKWVRTILAPLFIVSLGLHGILLVVPMPSESIGDVSSEDAPPEEDGPIDLLSISQLATPAPEPPTVAEPEPPPAATPSESVAPPVAPQALPQPVAAEVYPAPQPPTVDPSESSEISSEPPNFDPPEIADGPEPTAEVEQQEILQITTRLTRGAGDSNFDVTDTLFPFGAWPTLGQWSAAEQSCFFADISEDTFTLRSGAEDVRFLSRNIEFVEREDLPRTFPEPEFQLIRLDNGYCNRTFYEVMKDGQPVLFLSVVGIGPGNP